MQRIGALKRLTTTNPGIAKLVIHGCAVLLAHAGSSGLDGTDLVSA